MEFAVLTPETPETQQSETAPARKPRRRWFKGLAIGDAVCLPREGGGSRFKVTLS